MVLCLLGEAEGKSNSNIQEFRKHDTQIKMTYGNFRNTVFLIDLKYYLKIKLATNISNIDVIVLNYI